MFTQDGYEATTMQAIAHEAGVAVQTVYFTFRTKAGLLREIETRAIPGGDQGLEWSEHIYRDFAEERNAERLIALWVTATATVLKRITAFLAQVGAGLDMDAPSVERRYLERDRWFQRLIERLHVLSAVKPELTASRALDVARALIRIEAYDEMLQRWGWTEREWIDWATGVLVRELLGEPVLRPVEPQTRPGANAAGTHAPRRSHRQVADNSEPPRYG
ncbi:MAG: TetR/AcrR family transcriptional regulator; helix-turn-helix transcriptional regulator [Chloroflexi bacterium]|nr:TetR/AcrR family transcriptional regulator; helix-turn-helix transcriptional regulator [Chloroflexota bacterium]